MLKCYAFYGFRYGNFSGRECFLAWKEKKRKKKKTIAVDEIWFAGWVKLSQKTASQQIVGKKGMLVD